MSEQSRQLEEIINAVPVGVAVLDDNLQVLLANAAAVKRLAQLGFEQEMGRMTHLGDQPIVELLTPAAPTRRHEVLFDQRAYDVQISPIGNNGSGQRWVLVIDEVTDAREVQQRAQTQDRLAAIGQLAAGIAHDFNNLLAVIVLHAEMGLLQPDTSARLREYLDIILKQAVRAGDLVQQVLDFSRRAVLERRPLRLGPFVAEQVDLLARTLPENITVSFADEDVDYTVSADPTRLQQVIVNLALNARDAMAQGGSLWFALEEVTFTAEETAPLPDLPPGRFVRFSVKDTGHGIPAHVLPHIFEPFYTTKAPLGTGLGLAQVHGIVKQHEGEIDVISEAGVGTTFALYLPAVEPIEPAPETLSDDALPMGRGETVLVVEDDAAVRMALVASLDQLGYLPVEARNGREALALLQRRSQDFDLVLSDLIMPGMGGRALQEAMREQSINLPIVFLSGHPMDMEPLAAGEDELAGWLQKPVNLENLARLLARILALRRQPRP
jgi:two-component system, cell cycle sensor histidine kinase and response regulator CckA